MVANMKFGECLRFLLSVIDISIVRLSKAINVDSSLVNRWVNEKRTPAYNTNYIEKISEYLSGCVLNTFQEQYINELFLKVCGEDETELVVKEKIKKILLQAQGYSMEYRKKLLNEKKFQLSTKEEISKLADSCPDFYKKNDNIKTNAAPLSAHSTDFLINLSSEDKIIMGYKNILQASISLLHQASLHKVNNDIIHISFNSNMYIPNYHSDLMGFRDAILKALDSGWNVLFLLKLDDSIPQAIHFIDFARPLINTGKFQPYYFKKYDLFSTYEEFIVVPDIGVLLGLSNNTYSEMDTAFYFRNEIAINIFKKKMDAVISTHAQPLVKYYSIDHSMEYSAYLAEQENIIGRRILYKHDFSILILPENLYIKLLRKKNLEHDDIHISLEFYKRRLQAFLSNIYHYPHTDIYTMDCINNLIKYRKLYLYLYNRLEIVHLKVEDVIEILKNLVALLEKYRNYNIVFITQKHNNTTGNMVFYCMVKERNAVVLEGYEYPNNIPKVRLSIKEPILVKAFEVYFNEILAQISPINKDKKEIIHWIETQINLLIS
jgi:hypothetical protein